MERIPMRMEEHCRLCSTRGRPLINIFSETGVSHKLSEKINRRLQLFVSSDDFLSKSICCNCCGKLDIFDQFVSEVHQTQIDLQKRTIDLLKHTKLIKGENSLLSAIEIHDDAKSSSIPYDNNYSTSGQQFVESRNRQNSESDRHVSVIKFNDGTRHLNVSSTNSKETSFNTETNHSKSNGRISESDSNGEDSDDAKAAVVKAKRPRLSDLPTRNKPTYCETMSRSRVVEKSPVKTFERVRTSLKFSARRGSTELGADRRILRSNPKYYFFRRSITKNDSFPIDCSDYFDEGKRREHKVPDQRHERKSIQISKVDFTAQTGNTLLSDLKGLKNSLLLRKVSTKNASVLTIPVPALTSSSTKKCSADSTTNKGCQTEILLGAKSDSRIVYQKISFEGRSFLEIGNENNAVISSNLSI